VGHAGSGCVSCTTTSSQSMAGSSVSSSPQRHARPHELAAGAPAPTGSGVANGGHAAGVPTASADDVATLREVLPDASEGLCAYVLRRCHGECEEAIEMLLGNDLEKLEAERGEAERRDEAERKSEAKAERSFDRASRRAINERNGQVRDHAADGDDVKLNAPRLPYAKTRKEALKGGDMRRYLDGQVVANKGEKYVVVDATEDWDGGSRGRVKTKGKRGPGYA